MNKQEVIEEIKNMQGWTVLDKAIDFNSVMIPQTKVLDIVNQLDEPMKPPEPEPWEPEKPVVPQFVADWYEDNKDKFEYNVYNLCVEFHEYELNEEIKTWFGRLNNKPIQTLVNMHQFGYEVEKEKLYRARNKLTNSYLYKIWKGWSHTWDKEQGEALTKEFWVELGVWDSKVYKIEEVEK